MQSRVDTENKGLDCRRVLHGFSSNITSQISDFYCDHSLTQYFPVKWFHHKQPLAQRMGNRNSSNSDGFDSRFLSLLAA